MNFQSIFKLNCLIISKYNLYFKYIFNSIYKNIKLKKFNEIEYVYFVHFMQLQYLDRYYKDD